MIDVVEQVIERHLKVKNEGIPEDIDSWISFLLLITLAVMHKTDKFGIIYNVALPYFVFMVAFIPGLGLFNKLGDYSYGVYLYGWPAQQIILVMKPEMSAIETQ